MSSGTQSDIFRMLFTVHHTHIMWPDDSYSFLYTQADDKGSPPFSTGVVVAMAPLAATIFAPVFGYIVSAKNRTIYCSAETDMRGYRIWFNIYVHYGIIS